MSVEVASAHYATVADLLSDLGVSADRVWLLPSPGTATEQDVPNLEARHHPLCELVNGALVEKVMGLPASVLAGVIVTLLNMFVLPRRLGAVTVPDGMFRLSARNVRIPDVAFVSAEKFPNGRMPVDAISTLTPDLAVEVLSPPNSIQEMNFKLFEYFQSGVSSVWLVDPRARTVTVYNAANKRRVFHDGDKLVADGVLAGFSLSISELFDSASLDFGSAS